MALRYICKCGLENNNLNDWTCHWFYGAKLLDQMHKDKYGTFLCAHPKLRAIYMFFTTKIEWR